jgi:ABC-type multidrug transport system ATPase subunit
MTVPFKWLSSFPVAVFFLVFCGLLTFNLDTLFTVKRPVWIDASLLLIVFVGGWAFEIVRMGDNIYLDHAIYFSAVMGFTLYGAVISPAIMEIVGSYRIFLFVDFCFFQLLVFTLGWATDDLMVTLFLSVLWPSVFMTHLLLVDNTFESQTELIPLLAAMVFLIIVPPLLLNLIIADWYSAMFNAVVVVCWLAPDFMRILLSPCWKRTDEEVAGMQEIEASFRQKRDSRRSSEHSLARQGSLVRQGSQWVEASPNVELTEVRVSVNGGARETVNTVNTAAASEAHTIGIGIVLRKVNLFLPNGQSILKDISLTIPVGATVAVMGPSGSGKSSITNVLSGRAGYGVVTGQIGINGLWGEVSLSQLRSVTAFVPQDDVMHRTLTCLQNVSFQAELRLPKAARGTGTAEDEARRVLQTLGLAHVADTIIGDENIRGVSGGQRKRVSIAMELVARPTLLFLDEPTSGLDSTTSHAVVETIVDVSKASGSTSLAVIHQPRFETLSLFDQVILLASGGHLVYSGPTKDAMKYFQQELGVVFRPQANPADTFMDAISLDSGKALIDRGEMRRIDEAALVDTNSFGLALSALWRGSSSRYAPPEKDAVALLPDLNPERCSWGIAGVSHARRKFLQSKLAWKDQVSMVIVLWAVLYAVCISSPTPDQMPAIILLQPTGAYFIFSLTQGVAAQKVFGGAERVVAWREAGVGVNSIMYFSGRDLAAVVDMLFMSVAFAVFYWPLSAGHFSLHAMVWSTFAYTYAVWGLNFAISIAFDPSAANMISVVSAFMCYFFVGLEPSFKTFVNIGGGYVGEPIVALSPMRWLFNFIAFKELQHRDSPLSNPITRQSLEDWLPDKGFPKTFDGLYDTPMGERWLQDPPSTYNFGTKQLYMLGLLFRFLALVCLIFFSKKHASGGGAVIEAPTGGGGKQSFASNLLRLLSSAFSAFLFVLVRFEIAVIMATT